MPFTDQFWRAVADYGVKFPSVGSLGTGEVPAAWLTEYQRVSRTAFASVLITGNTGEGSSANGQANFPQEILLDALHCRRFELDATYTLPAHLRNFTAEAAARARAGRGFTVRLSAC